MKEQGCGSRMLKAIATIHTNTKMILRTAVINATIGVRQGSPTSCFLFTLVVNDLIRNLKERCAPDGFLGMIINESKTQFMVINGEEDDRNPIIHDDLNITNCDRFTDQYGRRYQTWAFHPKLRGSMAERTKCGPPGTCMTHSNDDTSLACMALLPYVQLGKVLRIYNSLSL
ncbi:hypothetical protein CAPTEDRAFT_201798 [Capitella teleta]|uniref:Uncharacterized protein n=1 Tax=Capitella teleta TaxID=283909 RepID=R7UHG9_CAPTE|nr:hypothetical protein CAPTEDRAFT_201798 [Capitella teleta]|eukprot:ELU03258.1 hypothetical protein CAPTEDRAFT_201798 [Capitella teleta]